MGKRIETSSELNGWRKSTYSDNGAGGCVEIVDGMAGVVPIRDSKNPQGPALLVPTHAWRALVDSVKA